MTDPPAKICYDYAAVHVLDILQEKKQGFSVCQEKQDNKMNK